MVTHQFLYFILTPLIFKNMKKLLVILSIFALSCSKSPSKPSNPQHVKAYYRLKHIDKDGKITYSQTVTVEEPVK